MYTVLCAVCGLGSLQAPQASETLQLNTSPVTKKAVSSSTVRDSSSVSAPASSVFEPPSLSRPSSSRSSTTSQESDEMLLVKPQPPPALFTSKLLNLRPKLSGFDLVEGEMSPEESGSDVQDVESLPSVSSGISSDKNSRLPVEGTHGAMGVGSDVSSEPLTFHTNFVSVCNAVASSSDEELKNTEVPVGDKSKPGSKLLDMNDNIGKKESDSSHCGQKDSEMASVCQRLNGFTDQQKVITKLFSTSQYLPVTMSSVVVNMVLSSIVTQPEDQNSAVSEPDAANHSHENSECDMSISDEASQQETPSRVSPDIAADKNSQQLEKTSEVTSLDHANDANKSDEADKVSTSQGETRTVKLKSKSPVSKKSEVHSKSEKRDRSRSGERRKHRSRSSERKRNRSWSNDRSRKQSATRSSGHSPENNSSRQKNRKRSRSSSQSRRRRSYSKEHRSQTSRTSSSHSGRRREHSSSRSRESRRRRSRSRSRDSKRRSRSADRGRRRRQTRSRSRDRSRNQSINRDGRTSRDRDTERKDDKSGRQVDCASALSSKNRPSDYSHDSRRNRHGSPSGSERVVAKEDDRALHEKSRNSTAERVISSRQSDSDLSSAESGRQQRSREENAADSNRIAVISSSSGTNRRLRREEFESDEEPPPDLPTAYDPSEPTEDNFRDDRKASDRRPMPPHWVPPENQRMPMVDMSRPPPGFPSRLPPPPVARFHHHPPQEGVAMDMKSSVLTANHFGVPPSDGGRPPPPPSLISVPAPLPRPLVVQPRLSYSQPMLTTPAGILPQPPSVQPVRLTRGMNVDPVSLIVRGPLERAQLILVPPGVGHPMRLTDATSLVGLQRIVCPPTQGSVADLVRLPLGQPQPPPGTILSGPPFVSRNQMIIRPAPVVFPQVPERCSESSQSAPHIITNLPVSQMPRMSAANQPLLSNMPEIPFPSGGGPPPLPTVPVPPGRSSQPQPALPLSSSSASSPSSGSQDAEDLLLERYSAKPEPPQSLFPSQKPPDPPKPVVDTKQKSPDRMSEESVKSSDHSQPSQPLPVHDLKTTGTKSSEVVPTSTSDSLPSDPRLLVQFLLKQTRQSSVVTDGKVPPADDASALIRPSAPRELHALSENSPEITDSPPEKANRNKTAYSPSQADYLGEEEGNPQSENVREMKVCLCLLSDSQIITIRG